MIRQAMEHANLAIFPSIALVVFFIWSVLVLFWMYRKNSNATYSELSALPLDDIKNQVSHDQESNKAVGK